MEKNIYFQLLIILIFIINFTFQIDFGLQKDIIYKQHSPELLELDSIQNLDEYYEGSLNKSNSSIEYNFNITFLQENNKQIFIDYQSEYGCLNITIKDIISEKYCAKDKNNLFILNIPEFINENEKNFSMKIKIEYNLASEFDFDYSLKVSLRKPINMLEINSEHKILCQMEKLDYEEKYRCLFMIVNTKINNDNQDDLNLIIFPLLNEYSEEINIYADYINKKIYDDFIINDLNNSIPNETSQYINIKNGTRLNYIKIEKLNTSQYIYVAVESKKSFLLEIMAQKFSENESSYSFSKDNNKFQIYSINKNVTNLNLKFNHEELSNNSFIINVIQGKSIFQIGNDSSTNYIIDERESNLFLNIDKNICPNEDCNLTFFNLDENIIFYISYIKRKSYKINELIYGKSSRLSFNGISEHILLYEHIPPINNKTAINANLQLYKFIGNKNINNSFKIEAKLLSQEELNKIKINETYINDLQNKTEGKLNILTLATNIYLEDYIFENNSYLLIIITPNFDCSLNQIILGTSISLVNSLIYPAERIYHFGEMNNNQKVTYKLEGKKKYHLMRLELGKNSDDISWSVKRTYDEENYKTNDTDISFVTEYWINGRTLITMYINNGEDIYLTIYKNSVSQDDIKINYVFKYINSGKNGDFKNYRIKDDLLNYNIEERTIKINKLQTSSENLIINYYMRIIQGDDYIKGENLKSISLIESNSSFLTTTNIDDNSVTYDVKKEINRYKNYKTNCYITIIENYSDIELIAYSYSSLEPINANKPSVGLATASLSITGFAFVCFVVRLIHHCTCAENY